MELNFRGSYSPRFLGRKWVDPNMSRYRIRYKGGARSDVDYDGYLSSEYSEDERLASEDIQDSDSDVSYERGTYFNFLLSFVLQLNHVKDTLLIKLL